MGKILLYRAENFGVKTKNTCAIKIIFIEKPSIHSAKLQLKQMMYRTHSYNTWKEGGVTLENLEVNYSNFLILACLVLEYKLFCPY